MKRSIERKAMGRPLLLVALLGLFVMVILPAQAASVPPTIVANNSTCDSVGSQAPFSLTVPVQNGPNVGPGGVVITLLNVSGSSIGNRFDFQIAGGAAHDVIVRGPGTDLLLRANHYDYDPAGDPVTSVTSDTNLRAARGNAPSATFCYEAEPTGTTISGTKFEDVNGNSTWDEGEPGLEGWTIVLDGETSTVTDVDGNYSFTDVPAGSHTVCEQLQGGWNQTFPTTTANQQECQTVDTSEGDVSGVNFGNSFGQPLECGGSVSTESGDTSATFTRLDDGTCNPEEAKSAFVDIEEGDEGFGDETIVFIPRGEGTSNYEGTLSFVKADDDPNLLVLQYDPDADGPEDFRDMKACIVTQPEGFDFAIPEGETWCYFEVTLSANSDGLYRVTWQVFGTEDPRFK